MVLSIPLWMDTWIVSGFFFFFLNIETSVFFTFD